MIIKDGVKLCCGNCKHADVISYGVLASCNKIEFDSTSDVASLSDPGGLFTKPDHFYCSLHEIKDDDAS